ncbi:MAG: right-handed parallel beta-helix repeat-containing protein [Candidatus Thermoplasmatota archaeon]|nr:right-handed parallel beta-helix repeat-containing protein [Candidatus Thermoplasmatota archaeon]
MISQKAQKTLKRDLSGITILLLFLLVGAIISGQSMLFETDGSTIDESINETRSPTTRNFYVDSINGNDNWDGRSEKFTSGNNGPWKTLKNVDEVTTFTGGDNINFIKGGEWDISKCHDGFFQFRSSGSKGNHIILKSYGNGSHPKMNGNWGGYIDIRGNYVTLSGFEIFNLSSGVVTQSVGSRHYGVTIKDNYIHHVGRWGIYAPFGEFNLKIINNTIEDTGLIYGGSGIALMGDSTFHGSDIEIAHNKITRSYGDSITLHEGNSHYSTHLGTNISIHHNIIKNSVNADGIDITTGSNISIYNNIVSDCPLKLLHIDSSANNIKAFNNLFYGNASMGQIYIAVSNVSFYNNIVSLNKGHAPYSLNINSVNYHSFKVNNILLYKNLFAYGKNMTHSGLIEIADSRQHLNNISIISNIFTTKENRMPFYVFDFQYDSFRADHSGFYCNGNIYGPGEFQVKSGRTGTDIINISKWTNTYGHDQNGMKTDPSIKWISNSYYQLSNDSPCIDMATDLSFIEYPSDIFGSPIYGIPDIGAIEYVPPNIMGSDPIKIGREIFLYEDGRFRYTEEVSEDDDGVDLSIVVNEDWIPTSPVPHVSTIKVNSYNRYSDVVLEWTEEDRTTDKKATYLIKGLLPEERYTILENGIPSLVASSNESGSLQFELIKESDILNISITREDRPIIVSDLTVDTIGTGEKLKFDITASDMDGIDDVKVTYQHEKNLFSGQIDLKIDEGDVNFGNWIGYLTIPNDLIGTISYHTTARDLGGLETSSRDHNIRIIDVIEPSMLDDLTTHSSDQRDRIDFKFELYDNIKLDRTIVEIIENDQILSYDLIKIGDHHEYSHQLSDPAAELVQYRLNLSDSSGNENITSFMIIDVMDSEPPVLHSDNTDQIGYSGEEFRFDIVITDNRGISSTRIDYILGEKSYSISGEQGHIKKAIVIPMDHMGSLEYSIHARDIGGNMLELPAISVPIIDNVKPWIVHDRSDEYGTTGDPFNIMVTVEDNIGIRSVIFQFWSEDAPSTNITLRHEAGDHHGKIAIPFDMTSDIHYRLWVKDVSGNILMGNERTIIIKDNDPPEIIDASTKRIMGGIGYSFEIEVHDNIGIGDVSLFIEIQDELIEIPLTGDAGIYKKFIELIDAPFSFWFKVTDVNGNYVETPVVLEIESQIEGVVNTENEEDPIDENKDPVPETIVHEVADSRTLVIITMIFCITTMILILFSFILGRKSKDISPPPEDFTEYEEVEEFDEYEQPPLDDADPPEDEANVSDIDVENLNIDEIMKEIDDLMIPLEEVTEIADVPDDPMSKEAF